MSHSYYLDKPKRSLDEVMRERDESAPGHSGGEDQATAPGRGGMSNRQSFVLWAVAAMAAVVALALSGIFIITPSAGDDTITARDIQLLNEISPAAGPDTDSQSD